jgi:hypothetical protein
MPKADDRKYWPQKNNESDADYRKRVKNIKAGIQSDRINRDNK